MARPLRLEFPGALYHITSRGNRCEPIFENDRDRACFLETLGDVISRFGWLCHAYCLMTNHYHLVIETPDGNLSKGMRRLNGVYTQAFNYRHERVGHLFQGRFKSILVDRDSYLLELSRYVVLNPVRAAIVNQPGHWPWSSYRAMIGRGGTPQWLTTNWLLSQFGRSVGEARRNYIAFVTEGIGQPSPWSSVRQQVYLGDDAFIERVQASHPYFDCIDEIPKAQRRAPVAVLSEIADSHADPKQAMIAAHATGVYSYREIADHFGVHLATVGRTVRRAEMQHCKT